jgi:hypothetical protein
MKFDNLVKSILSEKYILVGTCVEYCKDDGNEIYQIVRQDDMSYDVDTYYHDPELEISKEKFEKLTGINVPEDHFTGYNREYGIIFDYDPETDIHKFYKNI